MKRTPLIRRTPLRPSRQPLPRQRSSAVRKATKPRDTGPDETVKRLVDARANGQCERCGKRLTGALGVDWSRHHRWPRRMGGTRRAWINYASNIVDICGSGTTGCHGWIEHNPAAAMRTGWLIPEGQLLPSQVPIDMQIPTDHWLAHMGGATARFYLDDQGGCRFHLDPEPPAASVGGGRP